MYHREVRKLAARRSPGLRELASTWGLHEHPGELPHRIHNNDGTAWVWGEMSGISITGRFGNAFDVFAARATEEMIEHAFEMTAAGTAEPYILTDVVDDDHERIALLERLGFERFRVWDHVNTIELGDVEVPATAREATQDDAPGIADALEGAFGERRDWFWERAAVGVAGDGAIGAVTFFWTDPVTGVGHFEPVGTHPAHQRRGLARAAMLHGLRELRAAGMTSATVNHNAENLPAAALYRSLGFRVTNETYGYRRPRGN